MGFHGSRAQTGGSTQPHADLVIDASDGYVLVVGATGSGKIRYLATGNCLWHGGPLFVLDPKGELAIVTASARLERGQRGVVLDPFGVTRFTPDQLNPLDLLDPTSDNFVAGCWMLARLITGGQTSLQDRFWRITAHQVICDRLALLTT